MGEVPRFKLPIDANQSVATLVRHQGGMTKEAAQLLVNVAATWAGLVITLGFFGDQPLEATGIHGNRPVHVVLRGRKVGKFNEFDIESPTGFVLPPSPGPLDPVCSNSLLRAISGGASLSDFEFPCTVFPEEDRSFAMPLPAAAKSDAFTIAQSIWSTVVSKLPRVKLADHTEKDAMGNTNLGTMFKVTSVLLAQGVLCKYNYFV